MAQRSNRPALIGTGLPSCGYSNIVVRNFSTILCDNRDAGTRDAYHPDGQEFSHGIAIQGSHDVEVAAVTIRGVWGDGFFIAAPGTAYSEWSERVSIHDSTIERNGRMGIVVNAGRDIVVERVAFDEIAISVFDIEPNIIVLKGRRTWHLAITRLSRHGEQVAMPRTCSKRAVSTDR